MRPLKQFGSFSETFNLSLRDRVRPSQARLSLG